MVKIAPVPKMIRKFAIAKKKALVNNTFSQIASPGSPRTLTAGPKNSNGPKGGSSKSKAVAGPKSTDRTRKKVSKVTRAKLNTVPNTPFNRSSRVNYRQLRKAK